MLPRRIWLIGAVLAGCGGSPSPAASPGSPTPSPPAAPLLIQVENAPVARPQSGLQGADIVEEYVAEGGISRFTAIYMKPPAGRVGPVRSARLVTAKLQKLYGGILVYAGAGTAVQQKVDENALPEFNEDTAEGDLFRVPDRDPPHNLYTDARRAADLVSRAHAATVGYTLWTRTTSPPASGVTAHRITVPVSQAETPVFTWDAARNGFARDEPDTGPLLDPDTHTAVVAATVIVQQVTVTSAPQVVDVNGAIGVDHDLTSGGHAQVFTAGAEYDATWSQPASGPARYTLGDGSPAPIAPGLVWICLVPTGEAATLG